MFCDRTEEFLSGKGIPFVQKDVIEDPEAMEEVIKIGVMTTPVTVIDGEVVVGFDQKRLDELLAA